MTYHGIGGAGYVLPGAQVYNAVVAAAAGGGFAPTDISGCVIWWDFSDANTLYTDDAATTLVSTDGDAIGALLNKGTAGGYATQSLAPNCPIYKTGVKNGLSISRYSGAQRLTTVDSFSALKPTSFFAIVKPALLSSNRHIVGSSVNSGFSHRLATGVPQVLAKNIAVVAIANTGLTLNQFVHIGFTYGFAGSYAFYKSGVADGTGTNNVTIVDSALNIGARDGAEYFNGDIGEIIIYDSALGTTDREAVESYLATKWGL